MGKASAACNIMAMLSGPGVQVVAKVPVAGPVPPPIMVVTPLLRASSNLLRADEVNVVSMPCGDDHALGGNDLGTGANDNVHARLNASGLPGFANLDNAAWL